MGVEMTVISAATLISIPGGKAKQPTHISYRFFFTDRI